MKSLGFIFSYLATAQARRNARILVVLLGLLVVIVAVYSTLFHVLMEREGQDHSWPTAVYWTLVTMSTLGFGDITFESDLGRTFSVIVLLSGSAFILVLLPFTFIQFFFVPWVEARQQARAPRRARRPRGPRPADRHRPHRGGADPAPRPGRHPLRGDGRRPRRSPAAARRGLPGDGRRARRSRRLPGGGGRSGCAGGGHPGRHHQHQHRLHRPGDLPGGRHRRDRQLGRVGRRAPAGRLRPRAAARGDARRGAGPAGARTGRPQPGHRRVRRAARGRGAGAGPACGPSPDRLGPAPAHRPHRRRGVGPRRLLGRPPDDGADRHHHAGAGRIASPARRLRRGVRGRPAARCHRRPGDHRGRRPGGASRGPSPAQAGTDYRIIEQQRERVRDPERYVVGDAAELEVLERAGIHESPSVLITTHDDDVNVYLTIYCRRLRPTIQIIARARLDRNVSTLHRAGADAVLSYASTGANAIWNVLTTDNTLQLAEGLDVFRVPVPGELAGRSLLESSIRDATGCTVVAVVHDGTFESNPDARAPLPGDGDLVLIGDTEAEERFLNRYPG